MATLQTVDDSGLDPAAARTLVASWEGRPGAAPVSFSVGAVAVTVQQVYDYHEAAAVRADLLAACKQAKDYLDKMGLDWLGRGPDPLEAAIARAERLARDPAGPLP